METPQWTIGVATMALSITVDIEMGCGTRSVASTCNMATPRCAGVQAIAALKAFDMQRRLKAVLQQTCEEFNRSNSRRPTKPGKGWGRFYALTVDL